MKYHVLINLTKYMSKKSYHIINEIFKKVINKDKITEEERIKVENIRSYAIIILCEEDFTYNSFIGKKIKVNNQEELHILENELNDILPYDQIINSNNFCGINLNAGLGNQLFQSLAIFAHANYHGKKFTIISFCNNNTHSKIKYQNSIFKKFTNLNVNWNKIYDEGGDKINLNYLKFNELPTFENNDNIKFTGYFQNELYLTNIKHNILEEIITFDFIDKSNLKNYLNEYFLHVRLGDYCKGSFYNILNNIYYERCLELQNNKNILVFSDDINNAKKLINKLNNSINFDYVDKNISELESLYLMINSKNGGIIANSTFSWWGGYLNSVNFNNKIFIPNKFGNYKENITINFPDSIIINID